MWFQWQCKLKVSTFSWRKQNPLTSSYIVLFVLLNPKPKICSELAFFQERELPGVQPIKDAAVLLNLGDSVTTDHISPAGSIARNSSAARYLAGRGLVSKNFLYFLFSLVCLTFHKNLDFLCGFLVLVCLLVSQSLSVYLSVGLSVFSPDTYLFHFFIDSREYLYFTNFKRTNEFMVSIK